jgi:hypothetical protein
MDANDRPLALLPVLELIARALGATHGTHWLKVKVVDGEPVALWTEAEQQLGAARWTWSSCRGRSAKARRGRAPARTLAAADVPS